LSATCCGAADGKGDDFGDVLRGDVRVGGRLLRGALAVGVGDVLGELGRDRAGLDDDDADVGLQLEAQRLRPIVHPPLGRGVDGEVGGGGAAGDRGDATIVSLAVFRTRDIIS
jgi:hypothetical protein